MKTRESLNISDQQIRWAESYSHSCEERVIIAKGTQHDQLKLVSKQNTIKLSYNILFSLAGDNDSHNAQINIP